MYKLSRLEVTDVGYHVSEEGVAGNVEWNAKTLERNEYIVVIVGKKLICKLMQ